LDGRKLRRRGFGKRKKVFRGVKSRKEVRRGKVVKMGKGGLRQGKG